MNKLSTVFATLDRLVTDGKISNITYAEILESIDDDKFSCLHYQPKFNAEKNIEQKWIPVAERLPEPMRERDPDSGWSNKVVPTDDVLCYIANENRMTVAWFSYGYNEWTTVDEAIAYEYNEITYWMPLPEPPEVEI